MDVEKVTTGIFAESSEGLSSQDLDAVTKLSALRWFDKSLYYHIFTERPSIGFEDIIKLSWIRPYSPIRDTGRYVIFAPIRGRLAAHLKDTDPEQFREINLRASDLFPRSLDNLDPVRAAAIADGIGYLVHAEPEKAARRLADLGYAALMKGWPETASRAAALVCSGQQGGEHHSAVSLVASVLRATANVISDPDAQAGSSFNESATWDLRAAINKFGQPNSQEEEALLNLAKQAAERIDGTSKQPVPGEVEAHEADLQNSTVSTQMSASARGRHAARMPPAKVHGQPVSSGLDERSVWVLAVLIPGVLAVAVQSIHQGSFRLNGLMTSLQHGEFLVAGVILSFMSAWRWRLTSVKRRKSRLRPIAWTVSAALTVTFLLMLVLTITGPFAPFAALDDGSIAMLTIGGFLLVAGLEWLPTVQGSDVVGRELTSAGSAAFPGKFDSRQPPAHRASTRAARCRFSARYTGHRSPVHRAGGERFLSAGAHLASRKVARLLAARNSPRSRDSGTTVSTVWPAPPNGRRVSGAQRSSGSAGPEADLIASDRGIPRHRSSSPPRRGVN